MKNGSKINLNILPNLIGNFNDKTNFSHKLSLTETQILKICKGFEIFKNIKFQKLNFLI